MASRESLQQQPWVSCDAGVLEGTGRPHDHEESLQQQTKTRRRHIGRATSSYWAALPIEPVEESNTLACLLVREYHQPPRSFARTTQPCGMLGTYADDVVMDATAQLRDLLWKVVRVPFLAGEAEEVKSF